jgi:hypothetical protein
MQDGFNHGLHQLIFCMNEYMTCKYFSVTRLILNDLKELPGDR